MKTKIDIYTEQERIFLAKTLELFGVKYDTETDSSSGITCTVFSFETDFSTMEMVKRCMKWNYNKNFY